MPIIEEIDSGIEATSSSNSREDSPSAKRTEMANMIEDDDVRVLVYDAFIFNNMFIQFSLNALLYTTCKKCGNLKN